MKRCKGKTITKFFVRCMHCKTPQELYAGMRTKAQLCAGCDRAVVYTLFITAGSDNGATETIFAGQVEIVTYKPSRRER